jgi:hypothetical protein
MGGAAGYVLGARLLALQARGLRVFPGIGYLILNLLARSRCR